MAEKEKLSIIVFSGELDKALAAFMLATTGASMGMEVGMFFTFWGLSLIKKEKGESQGPDEKMLAMMQGMKQANMPSLEEFIGMAHDMGVKLYPCSTTCGMMGLSQEDFRSEVEGMVGAAFFLGEARESKVSLFI